MPRESYLTRQLNMGHALYTCTVQPSTKKTYSTAERRWFSVAKALVYETHNPGVAESNGPIPALHDEVARGMYDSPPYIIHHGPSACAANGTIIPLRGQKVPRKPRRGHNFLQTLPIHTQYQARLNTCIPRPNQ